MSIRSSSVHVDNKGLDKDQVAKSFGRSFIELMDNFIEEDARLDVVFNCLTILFDALKPDDRTFVLKKVLMHFLRKQPSDFENSEKADDYVRKTLKMWSMFGRCSKTMGPLVILQKIEESYVDYWQFYRLYAETLIETGETESYELFNTFKKCMKNCDLSEEKVRQYFGPEIMSHVKFMNSIEDGDETNTVQFLAQMPTFSKVREPLAPKSKVDSATFKEPSVPTSRKTFTSATTASASTVIKNTSASSISNKRQPFRGMQESTTQESTQVPTLSQNRTLPPPKDDFTVFKDPTVVLAGQRKSFDTDPDSPTVCGNHFLPSKPILNKEPILTSTPETLRKPASIPKMHMYEVESD